MENQVRQLLEEMAEEVRPDSAMPVRVQSRSRWRLALNTAVSFVTVVVVAGAAFAGVRALRQEPSLPAVPQPEIGRIRNGNIAVGHSSAGAVDAILEVDPTTGAKRALVTCPVSCNVADGAWSPDGTFLAYSVTNEKGASLHILDVPLRFSRAIASCTAPCGISSARFSPTGDRIAYVAWLGEVNQSHLNVIGTDGTGGEGTINRHESRRMVRVVARRPDDRVLGPVGYQPHHRRGRRGGFGSLAGDRLASQPRGMRALQLARHRPVTSRRNSRVRRPGCMRNPPVGHESESGPARRPASGHV